MLLEESFLRGYAMQDASARMRHASSSNNSSQESATAMGWIVAQISSSLQEMLLRYSGIKFGQLNEEERKKKLNKTLLVEQVEVLASSSTSEYGSDEVSIATGF